MALTTYRGELIAGGTFRQSLSAGPSFLARWNGDAWRSLESNLNADVRALTVFEGDLIVGGSFSRVAGQPIMGVARWNGTAWSAMGPGPGGEFNGLGRAFAVYRNELVIAGAILTAGGQPANCIARWDGTAWHSLPGLQTWPSVGILALANYQDELVAGGCVILPGELGFTCVAAWNGQDWHGLGPGLDTAGDIQFLYANELLVFENELLANGTFDRAGALQLPGGTARWNGAEWLPTNGQPFGAGESIVYGGDVIVGSSAYFEAGVSTRQISRRDGAQWRPLGTLERNGVNNSVVAMTRFAGDVVVGGFFTEAGSTPVNRVAAWRGYCPSGDLNCDGVTTVGDIAPFVLGLTDPHGYAGAFPMCEVERADLDGNGVVSVGDIGALVALLTQS